MQVPWAHDVVREHNADPRVELISSRIFQCPHRCHLQPKGDTIARRIRFTILPNAGGAKHNDCKEHMAKCKDLRALLKIEGGSTWRPTKFVAAWLSTAVRTAWLHQRNPADPPPGNAPRQFAPLPRPSLTRAPSSSKNTPCQEHRSALECSRSTARTTVRIAAPTE